jgi:type II secretory pathway pseudopilin PulG
MKSDARAGSGEHTRPGRGRTRPRVRQFGRTDLLKIVIYSSLYEVFRGGAENSARGGRAPRRCRAFSLIEILLVTVLLSLIMLALMAVFNSTQAAFRASVTQTDVLEGGRATMDLLASDFRQMTPSAGGNATLPVSPNYPPEFISGEFIDAPVNFWLSPPTVTVNQPLVGASNNQVRTNQVQSFFILSCVNNVWKGVGYFVDTNSTTAIYPLYRYDSSVMPGRPTPYQIFTNFMWLFAFESISDTNIYIHHLLNGVVHLNVRAYDTNGIVLTNGYGIGQPMVIDNTTFYPPAGGEVSMFMCSNTLPAAVEIQMGVLEDRTLSRASSFGLGSSLNYSNYLTQQAGKLHLFRQRVTIPNCDPTAYQ